MPQPESESSLTPDKVLGLLRRRRWWIVLVTCLAVGLSIAVLRILPKHYVSVASIQVEGQTVSQRFVASDIPTNIPEVIQTMVRQVLSRETLMSIIEEFGLYPEQKGARLDLLADRLRGEISIDPMDIGPGGVYSAFQVSFGSEDPKLAQTVTTRLASLFIEENASTRTSRAENTATFMSEQLRAARARLASQDQRIRDFSAQHGNQLADRLGVNAGALTDIRLQLQAVTADLRRAEDQQQGLILTLTERIATLKRERSDLGAKFTPQHPNVVKKNTEIERWEGLLRSLQLGTDAGGAGIPDDPTFAQLKRQVDAKPAELARLTGEERRLKAELVQAQSGMSQAPVTDQQLANLKREYDLLAENVRNLEGSRLQSEMAENVEVKSQGQRFRLLDPATLPVMPSSPDRLKIGGGGFALGLMLGLAIAFALDLRDSSFHSEHDLKQALKSPVIIGLPMLRTAAEQRIWTVKVAVDWLAIGVVVSTLLAVELYVYRNG